MYILDKEDLISLVKGNCPNFNLMDHFLIKHLGSYNDNRGWTWNENELKELTEIVLYDVYKRCKESWKK